MADRPSIVAAAGRRSEPDDAERECLNVTDEKAGFCSFCRSRCGTISEIADGRLVAVKPNPDHPTGNAICPKGRAAPEIVHSARRLQRPLRRTTPKTDPDPGWVEITWEEALAEVADKLSRYRSEFGAETVAFAMTSQSSSPISDSTEWIQRFIRIFGGCNHCFGVELCNWHKDYGHAFTFGCGLPTPDYDNADLIVLWGHNPANSWLAQAHAIGEARARGARLIVMDPNKSGSAYDADIWCRLRPGTDAALALGLVRELIEHDGYDRDFIRQWTNAPHLVRQDSGHFLRGSDLGWASNPDAYVVWIKDKGLAAASGELPRETELTGRHQVATPTGTIECRTSFESIIDACAPYTLERVAEICWVPKEQVKQIADWFRQAKAVCYYAWTGIGQHSNAAQTDRAIAILHALTGDFDAPGGNALYAKHAVRPVNHLGLLSPEQHAKTLGLDRRPLGPGQQGWVNSRDLTKAILQHDPYPVRALVSFGQNFAVSQPDSGRNRRALQALEFHVHCDLFMNPTAEMADIVLPANSPWERDSLRVGFEISQEAQELVQLRQRMIEPVGESRSDLEIIFDLACRVGHGTEFFDGNIEAAWDFVLEPLGLSVKQLRAAPDGIRLPLEWRQRKYRSCGFATETGKVELYSELLHRHGYHAVPDYRESGQLTDEFPFLLTTANRVNFCHSQHRAIASLRRRATEPEVRLNPSSASARNIASGQWVTIKTRVGEARFRACLDDAVHPRIAIADYGWWQSCPDLGLPGSEPGDPAGNNYNNVVSDDVRDPISGAPSLRSFPCTIRPYGVSRWPDFRKFRVETRRVEAQDVVTLTLVPADREPITGFYAGQYITLMIDGQVRSYSITNAPVVDPCHYEITVKRVDDGAVSSAIIDGVEIGDEIDVKAPEGRFSLPAANAFPVVLLAAGIGITPFMSLIRSLTGAAGEPDVVLYYSSRNASQHAFASELAEHAVRLPNLTIVNTYTAPEAGDHPEAEGRLTAAMIDDDLMRRRPRFYMCGPDDFMKAMTDGLLRRGVPHFEIFRERFVSPRSPELTGSDRFNIRFSKSNSTSTWTAESGTILDFSQKLGIRCPNGCRVGQCESCAVRILSGHVRHLTDVEDLPEHMCLTCQAVPASDLVLDI